MTTLVRELAAGPTGRQILHNGGTITYCAYVGDRWVGWIGDGREWAGSNYGGRRWWCACRQEGDEAAAVPQRSTRSPPRSPRQRRPAVTTDQP